MASSSLTTWDFYNYHVQQDLRGGQFVSAESTLVAAGPPRADDAGAASTGNAGGASLEVFPIGLLESVAVQQNKQLQRIFEIGSIRSYFIPGRTIGSLSVGRTFYFGPSLLRTLYAYYRQTGNASTSLGSQDASATLTLDGQTMPHPDAALLDGADESTLHTLRRNPGHGYFLIDLASDLFAQPTGMAIYFKDTNANSVGAFYLNECYVQGHQMTVSSGSVLVMEGVSMQFDSITPLKVLIPS
jgi:hypothetical protein